MAVTKLSINIFGVKSYKQSSDLRLRWLCLVIFSGGVLASSCPRSVQHLVPARLFRVERRRPAAVAVAVPVAGKDPSRDERDTEQAMSSDHKARPKARLSTAKLQHYLRWAESLDVGPPVDDAPSAFCNGLYLVAILEVLRCPVLSCLVFVVTFLPPQLATCWLLFASLPWEF
jgi:hypothetical protein